MPTPFTTIALCGMDLACVRMEDVLTHIFGSLHTGRGGWLITANLDFLRRHAHDARARAIYESADLRVADGMPLVWASRVRGTPLPERVAGSSMVEPLCARAAADGRSVYLLGGDPAANEACAILLRGRYPALRIVGQSSPWVAVEPTADELQAMRTDLVRLRPDIVLVAFGSPKQENVIHALRKDLPQAWWIGVGISLSFIAGHVARAPKLMQALGLEWAHRLVQEPRRLFKRYIVEDLPFAFELFGRSAWERIRP
jgi:N-acetylglucosaminyldiphosphoundecaprenol N-acetyl-beta-D-mannosaminyltransferase